MPLSTESLPNKPLNGQELAAVIEKHLHEMLANDCMFLPSLAYGRCAFTVTVAVHVGDMIDPRTTARTFIRRPDGAVESDVPLKDAPADAVFVALERRHKVANPNLERIHNGMPIRSQARTHPDPGSPYGGVENVETRVAAGDYPPLDPPEQKDVTKREAVKYDITIAEELEAISTEGE